jgi:TPR repeat protein
VDQCHPDALFQLGVRYRNGEGVSKNAVAVVDCFWQAAELIQDWAEEMSLQLSD